MFQRKGITMENNAHVHILHNPTAGEQDNTKTELMRLVRPLGFSCDYTSVKEKGWQRFKPNAALLVIVGGDGTVRAVAEELLKRKLIEKRLPMLLLPSGTANNIASTLGISHQADDVVERIRHPRRRTIDVGTLYSLRKAPFFIEGMGIGLFPTLMKRMKKCDLSTYTREDELRLAVDTLIDITETFEAETADLTIDGKRYDGKFLMIEVLNTQSIGPNLQLAPRADPGDGVLHVAILRPEHKERFIAYLQNEQTKRPDERISSSRPWELVELRDEMLITSDSSFLHVDDELISISKNSPLQVGILKDVLDMVL